jgi:predicted nucleotidyltransferase
MRPALQTLTEALARHAEIDVARVYGSVAREEAAETSDVDLAVAFSRPAAEPWERVDALRAELQPYADRPVSVIDLHHAPTPLAYAVIRDGRVLLEAPSHGR